jgi:processive 1,2-diacylglycerol beta-glucosyltransferase
MRQPNPANRSMLFAMIEAGGGHKSPALAVAEAFVQANPDLPEPRVVDFCKEVGALEFDAEHKAQWDALLKRPYLTSFGYEMQDRFNYLSKWYVTRWAKDFFRKTEAYLDAAKPGVFFATHWLNAAAAAHARERINHKFSIVYFLTEAFDASSLHSWQGIDQYMVSSRAAADCLVRRGVSPNRIRVTGYPVRPSFFAVKEDKARVLASLGCDPVLPTLLMSSGAQGVGRIERIAPWLASREQSMNVLVVCSRNDNLYAQLAPHRRDAGGGSGAFVPMGFCDDMSQLLQSADLVAIKAGPASTFEALYSGKPIIFMDHVARFERMNATFVTRHQMGWLCRSEDEMIGRIDTLARNPELIADAQERIRQLDLNNGAETIAVYLSSLVRRR